MRGYIYRGLELGAADQATSIIRMGLEVDSEAHDWWGLGK